MIGYVIAVYVTGVAILLWMGWVCGAPQEGMSKDEVIAGYLSQALFWPIFIIVGTFMKVIGAFNDD